MVMDAVENFVEALGDQVKVFQGQFAMIQLAVGEDLVDQVLYQSLDP